MSDILSRLSSALADRYLLERELGQGGMATVYLARDRKHHRMVAIKVLRPELAATLGPDRFLHEIEIAAGLQHPHILPLLDSGEAAGFLYYVMPYVEGESLRERLDRTGEFPISAAVRILAEIAEALAYAHSRGVVHRDMKPENIMLSGRHPLVMDFGIAKAVSPAAGSQQPTTAGVALGTPTYMAPEQAAADPHLDHRVDIYALGIIGYELLTGSPPFTGTSAQQILAAHMTQKPESISVRRPAVPQGLATILMQCLEKRPADRPQSAEELLRAFEAMVTPSEGLTPTGSPPVARVGRRTARQAIMAGGAMLVVAIAGLLWQGRAATGGSAVARHTQLTFVGNVKQQEISPDGQLLAYVEGGETDRLLVKDLTAGGSTIPVATVGNNVGTLRWSPDGSSILFVGQDSSGQGVRVMFPRLGGTPRLLPGARSDTTAGWYAVLSPDGSRLASWYQSIEPPVVVRTLGTDAIRRINVPDSLGWHDEGDWSPKGRSIALGSQALTGNRWILSTVDLETGRWHKVISDSVPLSPPRWSQAGDALYYLRHGNELYKIPVTQGGVSRGVPQILQTGLGASDFSITRDGRLAYTKKQGHSNLWLAIGSRRKAQFSTTQLSRGTVSKSGGRFSPDGRFIAFIQSEQGRGDVFVLPKEGGVPRRVTSSGVAIDGGRPAWSQDGEHLAFVAGVQGSSRLRTVSLERGEERTYERTEVGESMGLSWAPQDRILYQRPGNRNFNWLDRTTGAEEPLVTNDSVGWMGSPFPSPDRRQVAVFWNRQPHRGVYMISLQDAAQTPVGPRDSWPLGWSVDATSIYVEEESSHRIHRIPVRGGTGGFVGTNPFSDASCDLTERPPGIALLCNVEESVSDVWVMENFDPAHRP